MTLVAPPACIRLFEGCALATSELQKSGDSGQPESVETHGRTCLGNVTLWKSAPLPHHGQQHHSAAGPLCVAALHGPKPAHPITQRRRSVLDPGLKCHYVLNSPTVNALYESDFAK